MRPMLGKNVLAVYPHQKARSEARFFPPMGIEYIAAAVKDLVEKITLIDMRWEKDYDLAGFLDAETDSLLVSLNWPPGNPVEGKIPELNLINRAHSFAGQTFLSDEQKNDRQECLSYEDKKKKLFTVVGGRWASTHVAEIFAACPGVDVVVMGDGEEAIRELAQAASPEGVAGLAWRDSAGVVRTNPPRRLAPISETLRPDRTLRRYRYSVSSKGIDFGITVDSVMTSHGCPFHCKFCAYNADFLGRRRAWAPRSPESVVAELKEIDAEVVYFADNNFCVDMNRVAAICDLIVKEGVKKTFALETRIDIAKRPDVLAKMARAGFRIILFGMESATDRSLADLSKGFTVAQAREAFRTLRRFPFFLAGFFIVGNVGESEEDMRRIAPFAKELGLSYIALSYLRADRGSDLEDLVRRTPGYYIADEERCRVYSDKFPPKELRRVKRAIGREFFLSTHFLRGLFRAVGLGLIKPRHIASIAGSATRRLLPFHR